MRSSAVSLSILTLVGFLLAGCAGSTGTSEADRRNEELMAALPVYPGAVLVQKHIQPDVTGRLLAYLYATSAESEQVLAFYQQQLPDLGWQPLVTEKGKAEGLVSFGKGEDYMDIILFGSVLPEPAGEVTPAASPLADTATYFQIRVQSG